MEKLFNNKPRYFEIQYLNSKNSIIPFLEGFFTPREGMNVLEIGSAEGGVLKAFVEKGCKCLGIELAETRAETARGFFKNEINEKKISFISQNIYDVNPEKLDNKFDLIILKDVIEHIHDQQKFMSRVEEFLNKDGIIFFGFPSWRMPFGGHQQCANSKLLSSLPYYHLLPKPIYKLILKLFGEKDQLIDDLLEIKDTGISTRQFEKYCINNNYTIIKRLKYFIAPIYEYKFGYKTKELPKWIASIGFFNDFLTFQSYYVIKKKQPT